MFGARQVQRAPTGKSTAAARHPACYLCAMLPPPAPPPGSHEPARLRAFAKYSGIAFQMLATIGGCAWLGVWLDGHFATKNPWFTIGLMLFGVLAALYQVIRSLTREE